MGEPPLLSTESWSAAARAARLAIPVLLRRGYIASALELERKKKWFDEMAAGAQNGT